MNQQPEQPAYRFSSESPISPQAPKINKPKFTYTTTDTTFAWCSILVGFLLIHMLPTSKHPLGALLAVWVLYAAGGIYLRLSGISTRPRQILLCSLAAILSFSLLTNGNATLTTLMLLLLFALFLIWIYDLCGLAGKSLKDAHLISHLANALARLPSQFFEAFFPALIGGFSKSSRKVWKTVGTILLGLVIALIPTLIIALLLSYDQQFLDLFEKIFSFSWEKLLHFLRDLFLGIPIGLFVFVALFGCKLRSQKGVEEDQIDPRPMQLAPRALLYAAVTPVLALYVLFFVSQWDYYISAFTHVLPDGLTYATYAREGFFQLCTVCAINAILLFLFHILMIKKIQNDLTTRIYTILISLFSLILIATAFSKMLLYINSYGLTQKRVYASWFMLVLTLAFLAILVRQIWRKFPTTSVILIGSLLLVSLIALPNTDAIIARYNVNAYRAGELQELDVDMFEDLGYSAVPVMTELEKELKSKENLTEEETAILERLSSHLKQNAIALEQDKINIFSYSIPKARAQNAIKNR